MGVKRIELKSIFATFFTDRNEGVIQRLNSVVRHTRNNLKKWQRVSSGDLMLLNLCPPIINPGRISDIRQ